MKNTIASVALAIATCFAAAGSQAAVIDFNGLGGADVPGAEWVDTGVYTYFRNPLQLGGYTFTTPNQDLYLAGDANANMFCQGYSESCAKNGTDYLLDGPALTVRRTDGGAFTLKGFDLDNYFDSQIDNSSPAQTAYLLTAIRSGGATVQHTLTLDDVPNDVSDASGDFQHVGFDDLDGITSFTLTGVTPRGWQAAALDNLDVDASPASPVPEPGSCALLGLGLATIAGIRARRR